MILKEKDAVDNQVLQLEQALTKELPADRRRQFEADLAKCRAGQRGEAETAYHIDFALKDSENWAVIHDLRVEWNDRVAQMDHVLIDRVLEIYVVESKSFRKKIRFANGGWERLNFNHWEGIPSPVEQNARHIAVLEELISENELAPKRLGIPLRPTFINVVAVQPSCSIVGEIPEDAYVYRTDSLVRKIRERSPSAMEMLKLVAPETLQAFAADLVTFHQPAPKRELLASQLTATIAPPPPGHLSQACQGCGSPLSSAEANYCRQNASRFAGRFLCRTCQNSHGRTTPQTMTDTAASSREARGLAASPQCTLCGGAVDAKVVAFCRFNSKRFGGRILCRACQPRAGTQ